MAIYVFFFFSDWKLDEMKNILLSNVYIYSTKIHSLLAYHTSKEESAVGYSTELHLRDRTRTATPQCTFDRQYSKENAMQL